jgi:hypothetical protein
MHRVVKVETPPAADGEGRGLTHYSLKDAPYILQEQVKEGLPLLFWDVVHVGFAVCSLVGQGLPSSKPSSINQPQQVKVEEEGGDPLAVLHRPAPAFVVHLTTEEVAGADVVPSLEGLLYIAAPLRGSGPHGPHTGVRMLSVHGVPHTVLQ